MDMQQENEKIQEIIQKKVTNSQISLSTSTGSTIKAPYIKQNKIFFPSKLQCSSEIKEKKNEKNENNQQKTQSQVKSIKNGKKSESSSSDSDENKKGNPKRSDKSSSDQSSPDNSQNSLQKQLNLWNKEIEFHPNFQKRE